MIRKRPSWGVTAACPAGEVALAVVGEEGLDLLERRVWRRRPWRANGQAEFAERTRRGKAAWLPSRVAEKEWRYMRRESL